MPKIPTIGRRFDSLRRQAVSMTNHAMDKKQGLVVMSLDHETFNVISLLANNLPRKPTNSMIFYDCACLFPPPPQATEVTEVTDEDLNKPMDKVEQEEKETEEEKEMDKKIKAMGIDPKRSLVENDERKRKASSIKTPPAALKAPPVAAVFKNPYKKAKTITPEEIIQKYKMAAVDEPTAIMLRNQSPILKPKKLFTTEEMLKEKEKQKQKKEDDEEEKADEELEDSDFWEN